MACARILVVDDNPAARQAMCEALRTGGYAVDEAADGAQALHRLKTAPPDVLVTDILMPCVDGFELITAAKRDHPAVPILAVSERDPIRGLDLLQVAATLGADAVLPKPFTASQLVKAVVRLAEPRRRRGAG